MRQAGAALLEVAAMSISVHPDAPQGGTLAGAVPGGGASGSYAPGLYYAEVWLWSSSAPLATFTREPAASAIDLRTGSASGIALTIQ